MDNWDTKFMNLARHVSTWSKDRSKKLGCVIVGPGHNILTLGYNGFPRRVNDNVEARHQRPAKYLWSAHAERNAIANAAKIGTALDGSTIYLSWYPCAGCACEIIQAGILHIHAVNVNLDDPNWADSFAVAKEMLAEAGVAITLHEPTLLDLVVHKK